MSTTTPAMQKVTCRNVAVGDVLLCRNYDPTNNDRKREVVPMTVARITSRDSGLGRITYSYWTADGTYITYAGGATQVSKVLA